MPRIPTFQSSQLQETVAPSPSTMAASSLASADQFAAVGQAAKQVFDAQQEQAEKEKQAERVMKSLEIERDFSADVANYTDSLSQRQDYDAIQAEAPQQLQALREKYAAQVAGDPVLQVAFERKFNQESATLTNLVRTKKADSISKRALGAFQTQYNQSLQDYAGAADPTQREMIAQGLEIGVHSLVSSGVMDPATGENTIQKFTNESERVRAERAIEADPVAANEAIRTGGYPNLDPQVRQQMAEKATLRIKQNEQDAKTAAAAARAEEERIKKDAQDKADRGVADLMLAGRYGEVGAYLSAHPEMDGVRVESWRTAAQTAAERGIGKVDPVKEQAAIVKITEMMAKGEDPEAIRFAIATGELSPANQEQYSSRLDTKLEAGLKQGLNEGHDIIVAMVFPQDPKRAGIMGFNPGPLQNAATIKAENHLYQWVMDAKRAGKYPSIPEIRNKAMEFGQQEAVTFSQLEEAKQRDRAARQAAIAPEDQ